MKRLKQLLEGFERFQRTFIKGNSRLFDRLRDGQRPQIMVIGCSDSRVAPALLFDCEPGDIFVVRNIANLVPPYEPDDRRHGVSAALEYGVKALEVTHIVILGHSKCGGICQLMTCIPQGEEAEFIDKWVDIAAPAREAVLAKMPDASSDDQLRACEQAAILVSIDNLLTFPWIERRVMAGELTIHGWYFDIETGELFTHDPDMDEFVPMVPSDRTVSSR
ncbi:MAG: carbonic anhydrase [Proteobacteria bacterium]|nr:carbonic anhydrase [Pseudomonadota bacterium]MBU1611306.1 carbonic anhydrase [Pseudomonadota bacterium]